MLTLSILASDLGEHLAEGASVQVWFLEFGLPHIAVSALVAISLAYQIIGKRMLRRREDLDKQVLETESAEGGGSR